MVKESLAIKKPEPNLVDVLNELKRNIMLSLNTQSIGVIEDFNPSDQTCTVKIAYDKSVAKRQRDGTYKTEAEPYPLLLDVPLLNLYGGSAGITLPVQKGDHCIVLYNDRDFDNWWAGETSGEVNSSRVHSFSDAIAIVGVRNSVKSLSSYSTENLVIFNGENKVTVSGSDVVIEVGESKITVGEKIKIEVSGTSLGEVITNLCDAIISNPPVAQGPTSPTNISALISAINQVKTALQGVLE